jgi:hypothetical protein
VEIMSKPKMVIHAVSPRAVEVVLQDGTGRWAAAQMTPKKARKIAKRLRREAKLAESTVFRKS